MTVERVAATSGVAKTTIYRRFHDRRDMLQTALAGITELPTPAPEVPTREKIRWALASARDVLENVLGLTSVAVLLAGQDEEFTESVRAVLRPHTDRLVDLLQAAVEAGNVRSDIDLDAVLHLMLSASLGERLLQGEVRQDWLDHTVEILWSGIGADRGPDQRR